MAASVGCVVAEVAIWGLTFASPSFNMPDWIFGPFFGFAILGNLAVVGLVAATHGRRPLPRLVPPRVIVPRVG